MPSFLAVALNAASRSQVPRTALMPCSVKCMAVMKVAIATLPPRRKGCQRGYCILAARPRRLTATGGLALATTAGFEMGLGNLTEVRDTIALAVLPTCSPGVEQSTTKAQAGG